jgi:uncharacterized heparinase superfamily protein
MTRSPVLKRAAPVTEIAAALHRVGPRPVLLTRHATHRLTRSVAERRLRRSYDTRVACVSSVARLRPWPLDLPRKDDLPEPLRAAGEQLIAEADEIVSGYVDVLGSGPTEIGPEVDWHRDFKSGYRWPESFFMDIEVTRLDDDSDAKVPWDLSRSHHLLTMARAARLTGDERYARAVERQITSWLAANPTGIGINWAQPMEIALRAVNWVWILRTLEPAFPVTASLRQQVLASLQSHGRHVSMTLEGTPYLRSNHYLSNILGLLVLGAALDGDPRAARWMSYATRAFEREMQAQVLEDGTSFEASVGYHGLVVEMFLLAWLTTAWRGVHLSPHYESRLQRMLTASRVLRHPDGRVPLFGDVDSGRVLPGSFARPASHDAMLGLGAAILGRDRPFDDAPSPEVAWTLGVSAWASLARRPVDPLTVPRSLPKGGIYVLQQAPWRAVVRCGAVGQNGNGGHSHNDVGSYELVRGVRFVIDPGNYAYTFDPPARNEFRSTRAHNTVTIDGEEINPLPAQLFRLPQFAHPVVNEWRAEAPQRLDIEHDGYRRLAGAPRHRRRFELGAGEPGLTITDTIDGTGTHRLESNVHLAPDVDVELIGANEFRLRHASGEQITLRLTGDGVTSAIRDGWVAPEYGIRKRSKVIVTERTGRLPGRIEHRFDQQEAR